MPTPMRRSGQARSPGARGGRSSGNSTAASPTVKAAEPEDGGTLFVTREEALTMTESELKTRAMAARVMKIADSHSTNGKLSRTELESTLGTTEFAPFLGWLTKDGGANFARFDDDLSGDIDLKELEISLGLFEAETRERNDRAAATLGRVCRRMAEQQARLVYADVAQSSSAVTDNWYHLFNLYDTDGSGHLSVREMKHIIRKELKLTQKQVSDVQVDELWEVLDYDGSGFVDYKEFAAFMKQKWKSDKPPPKLVYEKWARTNLSRTKSELQDLTPRTLTRESDRVDRREWLGLRVAVHIHRSPVLERPAVDDHRSLHSSMSRSGLIASPIRAKRMFAAEEQ